MKLQYFPDTDTLYIDLRDVPSTASEEIAPNMIIEYDMNNAAVGITIEEASTAVDLTSVSVHDLSNVHITSGPQHHESVA